MGEVWLAADEELDDRPVAIKVMHSAMLADAQDVARFRREMRVASRMNHPNIMTVFTTGADNGVPFMVMEYLEGSDLGKMPSSWSAYEVARIGRETCAALAYAHGLSPGVVHRDIKPANLFICNNGQVKVTDFGIAKAVSGTRLSATGSWIGTLPYMAPEHWLGEPAAFSNDIWAVGCVLYELVSGRLPRSYATPAEYVAAAARGERVAPLPAAAGVLAWLPDAVMAMLQPDLRDRPTAAQCVQLLSGPPAYAALGATPPVPMPLAPAMPTPSALAASGATGTGHSPQHASTWPTPGGAPLSQSAARPARQSPRRSLVLAGALAAVAAVVLVTSYVVTRGGGHGSQAGDSPGVPAPTLPASGPAVAYVVGEDTVTPMSTAADKPGKPITVAADAGVIAITPDGKTIYVASDNSDTVTPITTATGRVGRPIKVGSFPDGLAIAPDGTTLYVANIGSNTVTAINTATNTVIKAIKVGIRPREIVITPDGRTAYVVNQGNFPVGSGTVTPITVATNQPGKPITVGNGPLVMAITLDGKTLYVANSGYGSSDTVTPISTATNRAGRAIKVGQTPSAIAITPDGKTVYVACEGKPHGLGMVIPISTANNRPGPPVKVGVGPQAVVITPDGRTAYVLNNEFTNEPGTVTPTNLATNTTGPPIHVGTAFTIAITPNGNTVYVAEFRRGTVTPISTATDEPGMPIKVGKDPTAIAFAP